MDEYKAVVAEYDRLCTQRNNNQFWAENITDATQPITQAIVWQNFYAYLANSKHKFCAVWQHSLGEQVEEGLLLEDGNQTFKTIRTQNGPVTYIRLTPDNKKCINKEHGKQVVDIPEGIPEEKSNS